MSNQMTVEVDGDICLGSGLCAAAVPSVFALDEDTVELRAADGRKTREPVAISDHLSDAVRSAVLSCPAGAITAIRKHA